MQLRQTMPHADYLGAAQPQLVLYLPHRPKGLPELLECPSAQALMAGNSNHWRKIITLLAKIVSPDDADWRRFRDSQLFQRAALSFAPSLIDGLTWHWIGGKDNLLRFGTLEHRAIPLAGCPEVAIDPDRRLLLTPYPDYRQLSNAVVAEIRTALRHHDFYGGIE